MFHPNIHVVSNYMEFDEEVSHISFGLGRGAGDSQLGCFPLNVNPDGRKKGEGKACWLLCRYLSINAS